MSTPDDQLVFYGPQDIFSEILRLRYNTLIVDSLNTDLSDDERAQKKRSAYMQLLNAKKYASEKQKVIDGDEHAINRRDGKHTRRNLVTKKMRDARDNGDADAVAAWVKQKAYSNNWWAEQRQAAEDGDTVAATRKSAKDAQYVSRKQAAEDGDAVAIASIGRQRAMCRERGERMRQDRHEELAATFKANGGDTSSTAFGLGETSRYDEVTERVHDIMKSSAGVLHPKGEATSDNWVQDHGAYISVEDVLSTGGFAAYVLTTMTSIKPGKEVKCRETTHFLTASQRSPLWRKNSTDGDLKRFTRKEAKSITRPYLLAQCVSAYDMTSLEGACQVYIENELRMPHGMCLHQKAGAGSRMQYSQSAREKAREEKGEACLYSLVLSLVKVNSPTFADVDPIIPDRAPPLTACSVTSHDGKTTYNVSVRGHKQEFPDTESVIRDRASKQKIRDTTNERHKKRKQPCGSDDE
jgi:hypothetical protein